MRYWVFHDFVSGSGRNQIHDWLSKLPPSDKAAINAQLLLLEAEKVHLPSEVKQLHGKRSSELVEVRIKAVGIQYRPLGHRDRGQGRITLLMGAIEKGGQFQPATALETALQRLRLVRDGRATTCVHDVS